MLEKNIRKIWVFTLLGITLSVLSWCSTPWSQSVQSVAQRQSPPAGISKSKLAQKQAAKTVNTRTRAS